MAKKEVKREAKKEIQIVNIVVSTGLEKDIPLDALRGVEGDSAAAYFGVFNHLILTCKEDFYFKYI